MAKSATEDCNSNVTVFGIVPRYDGLNEKVRSVNRLLRIYCRNMDIRLVGHENIKLSKHLNRSDMHLNYLDTPILTFIFLNVLNSLFLEQWLKSKGSYNPDKNSSRSDTLNKVAFLHRKFTTNLFFGQLNVKSVRNEFEAFLIEDKSEVFLISESKLNSSFLDAQFKIPDYGIFRRDWDKYAGSLMFYIN